MKSILERSCVSGHLLYPAFYIREEIVEMMLFGDVPADSTECKEKVNWGKTQQLSCPKLWGYSCSSPQQLAWVGKDRKAASVFAHC